MIMIIVNVKSEASTASGHFFTQAFRYVKTDFVIFHCQR